MVSQCFQNLFSDSLELFLGASKSCQKKKHKIKQKNVLFSVQWDIEFISESPCEHQKVLFYEWKHYCGFSQGEINSISH